MNHNSIDLLIVSAIQLLGLSGSENQIAIVEVLIIVLFFAIVAILLTEISHRRTTAANKLKESLFADLAWPLEDLIVGKFEQTIKTASVRLNDYYGNSISVVNYFGGGRRIKFDCNGVSYEIPRQTFTGRRVLRRLNNGQSCAEFNEGNAFSRRRIIQAPVGELALCGGLFTKCKTIELNGKTVGYARRDPELHAGRVWSIPASIPQEIRVLLASVSYSAI